MTGATATEKGFLQGTYSKSAKENGKLTWTKGSYAIWWSAENRIWIVGVEDMIGGTKGYLRSGPSLSLGLPYALNNVFEYQDGNNWVKPINEIFVDCTSLEMIGKQKSSKIEAKSGNGQKFF